MNDDAIYRGTHDAFFGANRLASGAAQRVAAEVTRPSVLYRPTATPDGDMWCALYGPDLMEGVAGFGETPEKAMLDFDLAWREERTPAAARRLDKERAP